MSSHTDRDDIPPTSSSSTERPYLVELPEQLEPLVQTVGSSSRSSRSAQEMPRAERERSSERSTSTATSRDPASNWTSALQAPAAEEPEGSHSERAVQQRDSSRLEGELEPVPSGRDTRGTRDGRDQPETSRNRVETQDPEDSVSAVGQIKADLQLDSSPSDSAHWKVGRTSSHRESVIIDTPIRRSHRAFVRSGL